MRHKWWLMIMDNGDGYQTWRCDRCGCVQRHRGSTATDTGRSITWTFANGLSVQLTNGQKRPACEVHA